MLNWWSWLTRPLPLKPVVATSKEPNGCGAWWLAWAEPYA